MSNAARVRRFWKLFSVCVGFIVLSAAALLFVLQTSWFKNKVRERVVEIAANAAGGKVEIGSFNYDWRTLTAQFGGFVVHGTEVKGAAPLFQAESITIGLKFNSLLTRDMDIASLEFQRPVLNLAVGPDGATNIPNRVSLNASKRIVALFKVRVKRLKVVDGSIDTDLRQIPVSLYGQGLDATLLYKPKMRQYDSVLSLHELRFDSGPLAPFQTSLKVKAELQKDGLRIEDAALQFKHSLVNVTGTVEHFARPRVSFNLSGRLATDDIEDVPGGFRHGKWTIEGTGHYQTGEPVKFGGRITAANITCPVKRASLQILDLQSDFSAKPGRIDFTHTSIRSTQGRFEGAAHLDENHSLSSEGVVSQVNLPGLLMLFADKRVSWSGIAAGTIRLNAELGRQVRIGTAETTLNITPGLSGLPVSGKLRANYQSIGALITFGESQLKLGNSQLAFSGALDRVLDIKLDSRNLDDLKPVLRLANARGGRLDQIRLLQTGSIHFEGSLIGPLADPEIKGNLDAVRFRLRGHGLDSLQANIAASSQYLDIGSFAARQGTLQVSGSGRISLPDGVWTPADPVTFRARFEGADLAKVSHEYPSFQLPLTSGIASGTVLLDGSLLTPHGSAQLALSDTQFRSEHLQHLQVDIKLDGDQIEINHLYAHEGSARAILTGAYKRDKATWKTGDLNFRVDTNQFPASGLRSFAQSEPALEGLTEIHASASAHLAPEGFELRSASGRLAFSNLTIDGIPFGAVTINATTEGRTLNAEFQGKLRDSHLSGKAETQLVKDLPTRGQVLFGKTRLATLSSILEPRVAEPSLAGFIRGAIAFEGPLERFGEIHGRGTFPEFEIDSPTQSPQTPAFVLRNLDSVIVDFANGTASLSHVRMAALGSTLRVNGSVPYVTGKTLDVRVDGSADLGLFRAFYPNVQASGSSEAAILAKGTWANPVVSGSLVVRNGTLLYPGFPNALTALNGSIRFDQNRATVESLTAKSGGGDVSLGGFFSLGRNEPAVYRLEASTENVRIRYAGSISMTANSRLRLTGTSQNSVLSGSVIISRAVFNPNTDIGNLLAFAASSDFVQRGSRDFLSGLQFDLHVESAPNLLLTTELSRDIEADVDLRLRGTPVNPVVIGDITANQGDVKVFGTKYSINRGEVRFSNPVKLEPLLDLDLQTQARGITVDITISGTPGKLNINYRSDPPLQPRDIIALLTVGRAPDVNSNVPNAQAASDVNALQSGANTVLGQAISPSSNRLSKLFGITNIKIDPLVQGITNTQQARLTLEQQISRQITVTYVTNLSQTSEQIFRLEWAFSPQYSLVALRDDNGEFGIDIQYKKRFK